MKRAMVRFREEQEKDVMVFMECLGASQGDTTENPLWMVETLSRSLGSQDVMELVRGVCHGNGFPQETTRLHAISRI